MRSIRKSLVACWVGATASAAPVEVDWKASETTPLKAARSFHGFLSDGSFLMAGGSDFKDGKKVYLTDVAVRAADGTWSVVGHLPYAVAEGVSCRVKNGVFCAGGTDGAATFDAAFVLPGKGSRIDLPALPEPVVMGAAAADGSKVYVVASKKVYRLDLDAAAKGWTAVADIPGPARAQPVAAIRNGDQKEKTLVVYGGYDLATKRPLRDGYALVLSTASWKTRAELPDGMTTIGAAFLPIGHRHILLFGGFGEKGWIARAVNGSTETDPVTLGWQRKILAYDCVTDAWCEYGALAAADKPRCGAAAGLLTGKTPESYTLLIAGGEIAPATRTADVSVAGFR